MRSIHRGWMILIFISLGVLACLGFGRFSLGAIIPFMKIGLELDYSQTGLIASSVFLGYLISAVSVGHFVLHYRAKKVIVFSMGIIIIGMVLSGLSTGFWSALFGCFLTGIGSGGVYVPSLGLLGEWFSREKKGMAMGVAMSGSGMGIVFSGLVIPNLVGTENDGWRWSWYILAILVLIILCINAIGLRNHPSEWSLLPVGEKQNRVKKSIEEKEIVTSKKASVEVYKNKQIWLYGLNYFGWGFSYIIFSTFLVDYLIYDVHFSKTMAGYYFALAGIVSIPSGFIWGSISDKFGRMITLTFVFMIQFVSLLSLSLLKNSILLILTIVIYSLTLWAVPTIMNASVSDFVKAPYVPVAMGFITLFFSMGQFISPAIVGQLLDVYKNYFIPFLVSSVVTLLSGIGCYQLHRQKQSNQPKYKDGNYSTL